jgi:predicted nicotinamide N-methyase
MTAVQLVRSATRLAPVPFVPEIRLHQVGDIWALWEQTERELGQAGLPPPFWGVAWPGGQALARYLLDHPALVTGRSVLDVGSGSGLVAIAAAKAGARRVLATETDPVARAAIELNAAANGVAAPACADDSCAAIPAADVVVAGDVWYERELAGHVTACFERAAAAGALVLAGDIGRSYFPRNRYQQLASYELQASMDLEGRQRLIASVWQASGTDQRAAAGRVDRAKCRASSLSNSSTRSGCEK